MASSSPLPNSRHCAYCLIPISGQQVKLCGGCGRRAYCSKDCQVQDWKTVDPPTPKNAHEQRGQGHRNWCKLICGEEDLDWRVAPIEGKGLGIIALKPIPARSRIIVEGCQWTTQSHSGIKDLCPMEEGTSLQQKWELNQFECEEYNSALCLRLSRLNHACGPNAGHDFCKTFNVKILFAARDIAPGEEISINYLNFHSPSPSLPPGNSPSYQFHCQQTLIVTWGITCPARCACNDAKIFADIKKAVELDESILNLAGEGDVEQSLGKVMELLAMHEKYSTFPERTLYHGFQIGIMTRKTFPQGMEYMNQLVAVMGDIFHPKSADVRRDKGFLNNPSSNLNHFIHDDCKDCEVCGKKRNFLN